MPGYARYSVRLLCLTMPVSTARRCMDFFLGIGRGLSGLPGSTPSAGSSGTHTLWHILRAVVIDSAPVELCSMVYMVWGDVGQAGYFPPVCQIFLYAIIRTGHI